MYCYIIESIVHRFFFSHSYISRHELHAFDPLLRALLLDTHENPSEIAATIFSLSSLQTTTCRDHRAHLLVLFNINKIYFCEV